MGNVFRIINYDGDIEISIYKKANAVFKSSEYNETEDVCIQKETINIFNLLKENQELKKQLEERNIEYFKGAYDTHDKYYTQQKELIKYLEDESKEVYRDGGLRQNIFRQILQKYEEIIGDVKNENNNV
jgi:hypothetical protein|nr:MAG TPA: hypothetical protein [Caudoviricetes sp.]